MRQAISMATVLAMSLSSAYRGTPAYASTATAGGRCTKTELSRRVGSLGCERSAKNWLSWQSRAISTVVGGPSDGIDALVVLAGIPVRKEHPTGYRRTLFPLWLDVDGDGCNTRSQVLRRESLVPGAQTPGCRVVVGSWQSSYDGAVLTNPADATVDHVVSLKETWDSGAWAWDESTRTAYANDTTDRRTLRIVSRAVNSAKGDRDPSNWLPPAPADRCLYLGDWLAVKARWHLSMDESEWGRVRNLLTRECPGWRVAPSSDPPLSAASRSALLAAPDAHPNASPPAGNPTHGAPSALPAVTAAVAPAVRHEPLRCTRVAAAAIPACVEYPEALVSVDELRQLLDAAKLPDPATNPGNAVNCANFHTWAQANTWYARYAAFGDPANLDSNSGGARGVVCESLPGSPVR